MTSDGHSITALKPEEFFPIGEGWTHKPDLPLFSRIHSWLDDYFRGKPQDARALPLSPAGTAFQKRVWARLLEIPWAETRTYGEIAREISASMSPQAVGGAIGRNPVAIVIPCHRILGAGGALTGYAWGLEQKVRLLNHEGHSF